MTILSLFKISRAFSRKIRDDYVSAFSAQAALFVLISFFPFTMFLLTAIQYLPFTESAILAALTNIFPTTINPLIINIITEIYDKASGTIISITAITSLWSASRGILAIVKGLNSVYGIKETRGYFRLRILSALYTVIFAVMMIITLVILVFGNRLYIWIEAKFPLLRNLALLIISMRTMVGLCILVLFFLLMYIAIPNRKTKIYKELPGALVTSAGWMGFSYLFSFYIDNMGNYSNMYGSLTVIVLFMLWFYFCMYILFIGGEINIVLSSGDLGYYLKQLFVRRKEINQHKTNSHPEVKINENTDNHLDQIIEKTMKNNNNNQPKQ